MSIKHTARSRSPAPGPPRDGAGRFVNWAGSVVSQPLDWRMPASEAEIQDLVRAASTTGRTVRVVGAGHSWSSIAAPRHIGVSLDEHAGVVAIDRARGLARVRGGTRLRDLNRELSAQGMALPIVGSIAAQSIAGAIGTGTHGSSVSHGNLADLVTAMRIVGGSGEVVEIGPDDERLDGARVHLGALGAVSEVTLRVVPAFQLAEIIEAIPIEQAIGALATLARSAEYVKVWWMPHSPVAQVFRYERCEEPTSRFPSPATLRWFDDVIMHRGLLHLVVGVQRLIPATIPAINRVIGGTFMKPRRVGPSHLMLSTPMPLVHRETEASMPLARADEALDRVVKLVAREELYPNFPVEVRFVRGDRGWMSPAHGGDACQLGAYTTRLPDTERWFQGFWNEMRAIGARPHWGKEHDHTGDELRAFYPDAPRFLALREEMDPGGVFANEYQRRLLD